MVLIFCFFSNAFFQPSQRLWRSRLWLRRRWRNRPVKAIRRTKSPRRWSKIRVSLVFFFKGLFSRDFFSRGFFQGAFFKGLFSRDSFQGTFFKGLSLGTFFECLFFFKQLLQISLPRWNPRRLSLPTNWRERRRNPPVTPAIRRMRRKFPLRNLLQVCAAKFLFLGWNELKMWKKWGMEKGCYEFCITGLVIKTYHFEWNEIWIWSKGGSEDYYWESLCLLDHLFMVIQMFFDF